MMPLDDYPIEINIVADYQNDGSEPQDNYYLFNYHIKISNKGDQPVTLLARHWILTDGNGQEKEVKGSGVVGEQPYIKAGESFEYSSFTDFTTPVGNMHGKYAMQLDNGDVFDAHIPPFRLAAPGAIH